MKNKKYYKKILFVKNTSKIKSEIFKRNKKIF